MTTIAVDTSYTLAAGKTLNFTDETAFELTGTGTPSLTVNGTANLSVGDVGGFVDALRVDRSVERGEVTIGSNGVVHVTGTGSSTTVRGGYFSGATDLTNDGLILAEGQYAARGLAFASGEWLSTLTNNGEIRVESATNSAQAVSASAAVVNSGLITASGEYATGVQLFQGSLDNSGTIGAHANSGATAVDMGADFHNSGRIEATSTTGNATAVYFNGNGYAFSNEGAIVADVIGIKVSEVSEGSAQVFENSGLIQAGQAIYANPDSVLLDIEINNTGRILGDVVLAGGADQVENSGKMVGQVHLGDGEDSYLTLGKGKLTGAVYGEGGNDLVSGGKAAEALFGDSAEGFASGDDTLMGGGGADTLTGGEGSDRFVYLKLTDSAGAKADLIADLDGTDIIDLSKIDADSTHKGNQAFHLVASLTGHAGEAAFSYDSVNDVTRLRLDVDGDGKADATILVSGDHHDFTGFIL